ncbi:MAG: 4Fe-4S ferredoxin [Candidatus Bathyarchaeota archaeon B26-2]|nr:MAG: 4Fe-4S ferredoxin [Candidatus Bathyarchaeota archaeon B26-2]
MLRAYINPRECLRCEKCSAAEVCPTNAIFKLDPDEPAVVEWKACYGCGDCVEVCPAKAIAIRDA